MDSGVLFTFGNFISFYLLIVSGIMVVTVCFPGRHSVPLLFFLLLLTCHACVFVVIRCFWSGLRPALPSC